MIAEIKKSEMTSAYMLSDYSIAVHLLKEYANADEASRYFKEAVIKRVFDTAYNCVHENPPVSSHQLLMREWRSLPMSVMGFNSKIFDRLYKMGCNSVYDVMAVRTAEFSLGYSIGKKTVEAFDTVRKEWYDRERREGRVGTGVMSIVLVQYTVDRSDGCSMSGCCVSCSNSVLSAVDRVAFEWNRKGYRCTTTPIMAILIPNEKYNEHILECGV